MQNIFENRGYISQYYCFYIIFYQMDIALVSISFQKYFRPQTFKR